STQRVMLHRDPPLTRMNMFSLHAALPILRRPGCHPILSLLRQVRIGVMCFLTTRPQGTVFMSVSPAFVFPGQGSQSLGMLAELRSEEHTSELQSRENIVCRLLLEKKKTRE